MKTYAFIDSQNLYLGIKNQNWELDYTKFYVYLKEKYKVNEVFIYIGYLEANKPLYDFLQKIGYKVIFKNTKQFGNSKNQVKGNIDVDLTVDAIRKRTEYKKAIFVSADGDFVALYDYLFNELKKDLLIIIPNKFKYSSHLLKYRAKLRFMNDLITKLGK